MRRLYVAQLKTSFDNIYQTDFLQSLRLSRYRLPKYLPLLKAVYCDGLVMNFNDILYGGFQAGFVYAKRVQGKLIKSFQREHHKTGETTFNSEASEHKPFIHKT